MKPCLHALALSLLAALPMAGSAAIVVNGSFENPDGTWVNTASNYMAVASGSTAITGWSVVQALPRGVAWAKNPTNDGFFASDGAYSVDLSGFGTEAGSATALQQTLQNLIVGETYTVGVDYWGDGATISIGGSVIATAGARSGAWTRLSQTFQATGSQALLSISYVNASSGVAFVDNVTVTGREAGASPVPVPNSLSLAVAALAVLVLRRRAS